ncbi:hypothetical protein P9112_003066 [Eukaryota sp. TZLM1-RC]
MPPKEKSKPRPHHKNTLFFHFGKNKDNDNGKAPSPMEESPLSKPESQPPVQPIKDSCIIDIDTVSNSLPPSEPCQSLSLAERYPNRHFPEGTVFYKAPSQQLTKSQETNLVDFILHTPNHKNYSHYYHCFVDATCPDLPHEPIKTHKRDRHFITLGPDKKVFKLFSFHDDFSRPPYFGTISRSSTVITPLKPLSKDPGLDYDIDSAEEWEDEQDAEDLVSGDDKEDEESSDEEDVGFVVDDGYLSKDEGSDEEEGLKSREVNDDDVEGQKSVVVGPFFASDGGTVPPELQNLAIVTFLSTPVNIRRSSALAQAYGNTSPWPLEHLRLLVQLIMQNSNNKIEVLVSSFLSTIEEQNASLEGSSLPQKKYTKKAIRHVIGNLFNKEGSGKSTHYIVKDEIREELGL